LQGIEVVLHAYAGDKRAFAAPGYDLTGACKHLDRLPDGHAAHAVGRHQLGFGG
jgi:hypothetical protein